MDKELLQEYINRSQTSKHFYVDYYSNQKNTVGYAHNDKGYYIYKIDDNQLPIKVDKESEKECIYEIFNLLKEDLNKHNKQLPDLSDIIKRANRYSDSELMFIFNMHRNYIEELIKKELLPYDAKEFNIDELGEVKINKYNETLRFTKPLQCDGYYVLMEYSDTPNNITRVIICDYDYMHNHKRDEKMFLTKKAIEKINKNKVDYMLNLVRELADNILGGGGD